MITFVPNKGELAVFLLVATVKELSKEFLDKEAILSGQLMDAEPPAKL